ncbi:MAG: type I DNA topoisomerase [Anaerolineae bacterium]
MSLEAYCMKCRTKRPMDNPVAEYNAAGRPVTRGTCPECGTALYRMGETPAHADVPKPEKTETPPKKATRKVAADNGADLPVGETVSGPGEAVEAYCVKCREKRVMAEPRAEITATGRAGTKGVCPVCGTTLYRPGETLAHVLLPHPSAEAAQAARQAAKRATKKAPTKPAPTKAAASKTAASKATATKAAASKATASKTAAKGGAKAGSGRKAASSGGRSAYRGSSSFGDATMRGGKLVIVESPAKARTIGKFLGGGYRVRASVGHVRDLLKSQLSVDVEHDFEPKYRVPDDKRDIVKDLTTMAKGADQVFLATDPDREGEAIAWHLMEAAKIDPTKIHRVEFHEITRSAIMDAFSHPRTINMDLVDAQQARRILDRLVGYKISPILWDKVRSRLSAGRVQTVALRLIVEREREIQSFIPEEYWSLEAELAKIMARGFKGKAPSFRARLIRIGAEKADLKNQTDARAIVNALEGATYTVAKVERKERRRYPSPPFTTSTLQQEASRRLGFGAKKTMTVAQQLYEGIDVGAGGTVGLITYMRTDSVSVSRQAQDEARPFITRRYGEGYLPAEPPHYKTRTKGAQEAHEAIRPTSLFREPASVREHLSRDQARLYELIWKRFVASQMTPALLDVTTVDVTAPARYTTTDEKTRKPRVEERVATFRATGSIIKFEGFLAVYEVSREKEDTPEEGEGTLLPPLSVDEVLNLLRLIPEQHFTEPPPRYTEATLVKALEEHGIGRPSTYAPIITTIQQRGYVEREDRRLIPTELGFIVCDLLVENFPDVFDVGFTADMESHLDEIADGEQAWVPVVREFYEPFAVRVAAAEAHIDKVALAPEETGELCEKCGRPMVVKFGRFGKFIACSGFPECRNTQPYLEKIGVHCPQCGGELVEKRSKRGRVFYGCANYPACNFAAWQRPLPQPCPNCGGMLTQSGKNRAKCSQCGQTVDIDRLERSEAPAPAPASASAA